MIILAVLLAAASVVLLSMVNWRRSLMAVFVLLVFEGAIRKWLLPSASEFVYFLKDLVLLGVYIRLFNSDYRFSFKPTTINILILMALAWCLMQAFNPSLGSPVVGLFGLRGYLFYIPLMWVIPLLFESEEALYKFIRSHLLLIFPVCLLGIAQFFSPPTSPLNVYAPGEVASVVTFGSANAVRVTGTFSYLSGFSIYLTVCFGLLIPSLSYEQSRFWRSVSTAELILVMANSFMTGARSLIFFEILYLIGYFSIRLLIQPKNTLQFLQRFFPPLVVITAAVTIWFQSAIDAFMQRLTANKDVSGRVSGGLTEPFEFFKLKGFDGYGTGATHQATPVLRRALSLPAGETIPVYFEGEMGKVALELGPFGFFIWYALRLALVVLLWVTFLQLKRPFLRELALTAFLIHAIQLSGQLVFHHTFLVYYWFFSSFIYLLPQLEQIENWYEEQALLQYYASQDQQASYFADSPDR